MENAPTTYDPRRALAAHRNAERNAWDCYAAAAINSSHADAIRLRAH